MAPADERSAPLPTLKPTSQQEQTFALRQGILNNGFEPIAVRGKAPVTMEWQRGEITPDWLKAEVLAHPDAVNTGIRTGAVVALDIDLTNAEHAAKIEALAVEVLGPTVWRRVGKKGCILVYQTATPMKKVTVSADGGQRVEVLGLGQHFVADGIHPDTRQPYRWTGDKNPLEHPAYELPVVTPDQVFAFADRAATLMAELGYQGAHIGGSGYRRRQTAEHLASHPGRPESSKKGRPLTEGELIAYLAELDPGIERDPWRDIIVGIAACPVIEREVKREIARAWSRGEYMHDDRYKDGPPDIWFKPSERDGLWGEDAVDQVFDTMPPKEGGIGIGTVIRASNAALKARGPSPLERFACWQPEGDQPTVDWKDWTADDPLAEPRTDDEAFRRAIQKMSWHNHLQGRDRRPSEYYPDTRLPKVPSGETVCILGLVTAVSGGGKTTVIGYYAAKVIKAGGRIVYFPGEGGLGLDTKRIPAWQSAYGLTDKQMLAQWRTSDRIPNVRETAEIEAAIFHHAEWLRETGGLAVFDTLKTATPGVAENESVMGDLLAGGGQFRKFGDAAGCTVLVAHHLGKDETRGSRGHSSIEGNSDFVHEVDWTKEARKLELKYRKDRDGEDGFSSYFATNGGGGDLGVPTIKKVDFQTFRALNSNDHDIIRHRVSAALTELFTGNERQDPVSTQVLAMAIRKQDIEREMKRAEDRNENYVRPDEKGEAAAVKRIQDNILNEHSKPADGKRAVLFHFVEKDADGNMALVSRQARRWRPAPAADDEQLPTGIAEQVAENDA